MAKIWNRIVLLFQIIFILQPSFLTSFDKKTKLDLLNENQKY